ncbi:hypothetical protein QOZ96_000047 [Brevundimonas nasdae]|uniref:DUF3489 domain-containing protein n=1 Tax=Brevundimonas nasdae TaxID=172043 RepID=UPI001911BB00|nr:DUF3489 domain-containing protein [Brevundimonas nasdae]MBK6023473.1 DUF3489 domain-containing protein [Brevundimonas nasdae]MDQ0450122.1 hypothetical protein [Brevundimonas nasdae]
MNENNVKATGECALKPEHISKISQVIALLRRPEGATAAQIMAATGWQAHSVRGAIAGQIRKKLGLAVATEKVECLTVYRITAA